MTNVRVITDSACDLPVDLVQRLHIDIVPLSIRFGDEEFTDRVDLSATEFWAKCKASSVLPETAAPSPGAFQAAYEKAHAEGVREIVVVTLASALSATHQSASLAAEAVAGTVSVHVVDSRAASVAQGLIVIDLAERALAGASASELIARGNELVTKVGVAGTIDTLEHLIKGGRLKGAKAMLGSVLSIKPLLALENGHVVEAGRARTRSKAFASLVESAKAASPLDRLAICHGNATDIDTFTALMTDVQSTHPVFVTDVGSTVGTHGGPGIVVVAWIRQ